jgi:hypothetical protein
MVVVTTLIAMTMVAFIVFSTIVMSILAFASSGSSESPEASTRRDRRQQHENQKAFHLNSNQSRTDYSSFRAIAKNAQFRVVAARRRLNIGSFDQNELPSPSF